MDLPSVKLVFMIVLLNIILFTLSIGMQSFFGGGAFIETDAGDELNLPSFPDINFDSLGSATAGIWDTIVYIATSLGILLAIFTFDINGMPEVVRFLIVTPFAIANFYIGFAVLLRIVEVIGGWIPFT